MYPGTVRGVRESQPNELLPDLRGWQIFFILASVIIGEGIFSGDREALEVAGPGGTLVALFLVGGLAICVMSCVSELVQLFPVPNAIVEYIKAFVDDDLAWCCGIAYWYTWTSVFVALYYTAVNFTQYWALPQLWHNVIFGVAPLIIFGINMLGVNMFGIVETIGGFLKILLVLGVGITMYVIHSLPPTSEEPSPIYDGFEANPGFVTSPFAGIFWVIPTMAYSFLGVESVAITAFEARDVHSLRNPSRWIAWVILVIYAFTLIAEFLVFSWTDPNLPAIYGSDKSSIPAASNSGKLAMAVVALDNAGHWKLASFINAGCIFSAMSASNAALYVASRTLYGLARNTPEKRTPMSHLFKKFSHTTDNTRVPALALFSSMLAFVWLPFLTNIQNGDTVQLVFDILSGTASVMCLIVWAALCAALLRFRRWYDLCRDGLEEGYERFDRQRTATTAGPDHMYGARTGLMFLQPGLAWCGMIGSMLVVLVLSTGTWWNGDFTGQKFAIAYTAPLCIIVLWPARKLWAKVMHDERRGWVTISADPNPLMDTLNTLQCAIPEKQVRGLRQLIEQHPWLAPLEKVVPRRLRTDAANDGQGDVGTEVPVNGVDVPLQAHVKPAPQQPHIHELNPSPEPSSSRIPSRESELFSASTAQDEEDPNFRPPDINIQRPTWPFNMSPPPH